MSLNEEGSNDDVTQPSAGFPNEAVGSDQERRPMNWQKTSLYAVGALLVAILIGGVYYIILSNRQFPSAPRSDQPRSQTTNTPSSTPITNSPSQPDISIFKNPNEPAYIPGKGFAPDAQRILEIASLQVSLERYRIAKGAYPQALVDLFPAFAPKVNGSPLTGPPLDPVTQQPYSYQLSADGQDYQLSATLDSGKQYSVTKANLRR